MKLGVVILNWNAAEDTRRVLGLVEGWKASEAFDPPSIWVVDNASTTPVDECLRGASANVRLISSATNRGFAGGNNLGIVAAIDDGCGAVVLLNNDATVEEKGITSMVESLARDDRIGVVGPVLWDGSRLSLGGRDISRHQDTHVRSARLPEGLLEVDYVPGTAALIRRETLEEIGPLDEDYFFGGEMADLCFRARRRGWRCVTDPGARATHDLERSSHLRETLHVYYSVRNRFLFVRKHRPERKGLLFVLWSARAARAAATALARGRWPRARAIVLGAADGLRGVQGGRNDHVLG